MAETFLDGRVTLHCGDCLDILRTLPPDSVDSCCTDPPYHLTSIVNRFGSEKSAPAKVGKTGAYARASAGFMGRKWDGGDIAFRPDAWTEVLRVLKPGAYIVAFSSTRTFGRMSCAIEDVGFITHPFIAWIFGQGFPKAHRVHDDTWEGWRYGTQSLKPAIEPIYVGQKPFERGLTGTANILEWGVGGLNIDSCRIFGADEPSEREDEPSQDRRYTEEGGTDFAAKPGRRYTVKRLKPGATLNKTGGNWRPEEGGVEYHGELKPGRWPANVILSDDPEVQGAFPDVTTHGGGTSSTGFWQRDDRRQPIATGDSGSAARFFYTAKADSDDRLGSKHPTVKPLDLMQYLVRLVTPPKGLVIDPFAGTGTTGEACIREGFRAILIEREAEYQDDIRRRMKLVMSGPDERAREATKAKTKDKPVDAGPLFGGTELSGGADRFTATSPTRTNDRTNRAQKVSE